MDGYISCRNNSRLFAGNKRVTGAVIATMDEWEKKITPLTRAKTSQIENPKERGRYGGAHAAWLRANLWENKAHGDGDERKRWCLQKRWEIWRKVVQMQFSILNKGARWKKKNKWCQCLDVKNCPQRSKTSWSDRSSAATLKQSWNQKAAGRMNRTPDKRGVRCRQASEQRKQRNHGSGCLPCSNITQMHAGPVPVYKTNQNEQSRNLNKAIME